MNKKTISASLMGIGVLAIGSFVFVRWKQSSSETREELLRALPADASSVAYVDVEELRHAAVRGSFSGWGDVANADPEYKEFIAATGFDYEKDLDRMGIATEGFGPSATFFVLVDGRFDRKKIEEYLRKNAPSERKGKLEIFHLAEKNFVPDISSAQKWLSIIFLSDKQIAITNAIDLSAELERLKQEAGHQEWLQRFDRLSGSPAFLVLRQEAAIGTVLSERAPGGIASPQLAQLLNQLIWVSIAGKPEGDSIRVVIDGECPNELVTRQLTEFLNGIALLAQTGLNDPKLRQKMDPAERESYVQLLNSVDVTKLDRGNSKSVRVSLLVTPGVWTNLTKQTQKKPEKADPNTGSASRDPKNKSAGAKAPADHR